MLARLRRVVLRDRFTVADQAGRCFQVLGEAVGAAGLLGAVVVVAALSRADAAILVILGIADMLALGAVGVLSMLAFHVVHDSAVDPLAELSAIARRVGGGDLGALDEPHGALELQQITATMGTLAGQLVKERDHRAADQQAGAQQTTTLRQILRFTQEVGGTLNLHNILRALVNGAMAMSGYSAATVWFVDDLDRQLVPAYTTDTADGRPTGMVPQPFNTGAVGRAATSAQTVTIREGVRGAGLAVPLIRGLAVIGVIELSRLRPLKAADGVPLEAVETIASHAATAIAASRFHHEVELRSETDALTRVLNRRKLDSDLRNEVARSIRYGHPTALVMVDIDHFKAINDSHGHQQGDEVLKTVAAALVRGIREIDSAYRFGGEEFAVLLRETDIVAAQEVADRLRVRIREAVAALGLPRDVTASLGVAAVADGIQSPEKLVEAADGALYEAKQTGRNRVCVSAL